MFIEFLEILVWDYLWGVPLVAVVLTAGALFTVRSGFFQFRYLGYSLKNAWGKLFEKNTDDESDGVISPLEAMSIALGTTGGVGNIGGVATAIAVGGPGAIFWMWIAGLFGQIIKMAEITLAVHYRSRNKDGSAYGGPNYYMQKGIGKQKGMKKIFKILSSIFAFGFMVGFFINIQIYTVPEAIGNTFDINLITVGVAFTVLLYLLIAGGVPSLGKTAAKIVPFMILFYLGGGLFIILKHAD